MISRTSTLFLWLNFGITWSAWFSVIFLTQQDALQPGGPAYLLYGLGGLLGPVVAAVLAAKIGSDKAGFRAFLTRLVKVRVPVVWYMVALVVPFVLAVLPAMVHGPFTGQVEIQFKQPILAILAGLPFFIIGGGLEEVGWRGVLLPELLKRYSLTRSWLMLAFAWAVWHVPLWFINGTPQHGSDFVLFCGSIMVTTIWLVILYLRTGSVLLCVLFHSLSNAFAANIIAPGSSEWLSVLGRLAVSLVVFALLLRAGKLTAASEKLRV